MTAQNITRELELATWEMAEAEACERKAHKLRYEASRRIASVHREMIDAMEENKSRKKPVAKS